LKAALEEADALGPDRLVRSLTSYRGLLLAI
jgi:hypothetical protein